jgi:ParB/RepB/Spo0J family partition protein
MKTLRTVIVSPSICFITPFQSREDYDDGELKTLAETLKSSGQLQNGVGREGPDGTIEVFCGCRRYLATIEAELEEFEVKIVEATDAEVITRNLIENTVRVNLKPCEMARAIKRALDLRLEGEAVYSKSTLGAELGLTLNDIDRHLDLLNAPKDLQKKADKGEVEPRLVMIIGSLPKEMQDDAIGKLINCYPKPKTTKEAEHWVAENCRKDLRKASFDKEAETVTGLPPCVACDKWGGNRADITGRAKGNVCLDPVCFGKKQAHAEEVLRRHAEDNPKVRILSEADARKVIDSDTDILRYDAPYVELDARPSEAYLKNPNAEVPKWAEILVDADAPVVWAIDAQGKHRKLVELPQALAAARMQANPHSKLFKIAATDEPKKDDDETLARLKRLAGNKAEAEGALDAAVVLYECLTVPWSMEMLKALLKMQCDTFSKDDYEFACKVIRPDLKKIVDARETLEQLITGLDRPEQMMGMIGITRWTRSLRNSPLWTLDSESGGIQTMLFKAAEFDGDKWKKMIIDRRKAAEDQVQREFEEKQKKANKTQDDKTEDKRPEALNATVPGSGKTMLTDAIRSSVLPDGISEVEKKNEAFKRGQLKDDGVEFACDRCGEKTCVFSMDDIHRIDELAPGTYFCEKCEKLPLDEMPAKPDMVERQAAPDREAEAKALWMECGSLDKTANDLGISINTVRNWHRRRGWAAEKAAKAPKPKKATKKKK